MNVDYEEELDCINKKSLIEKCNKDAISDPVGVKLDFAKYAAQSTYFWFEYSTQSNYMMEQTIKMFNRHFDTSKDHILPEVRKFLIAFRLYEWVFDLTSLRVPQLSPENKFQDLVRKLREIDGKAKEIAKGFVEEWVTNNEPQNWANEATI